MDNLQAIYLHWQENAWDAYDTAEKIAQSGKFHHALFFAHLALEKSLKSLVIKSDRQANPPFTHNLVYLAQKANLTLTNDQKLALEEINTFNLRARYEETKNQFYQKANLKYGQKWMAITKDLLLWLKNQ